MSPARDLSARGAGEGGGGVRGRLHGHQPGGVRVGEFAPAPAQASAGRADDGKCFLIPILS